MDSRSLSTSTRFRTNITRSKRATSSTSHLLRARRRAAGGRAADACNSNLRKEAALALGELREPSTLAALKEALDDADPEVRKAVRTALQQIADATQ